jgi:hypothetical protein
VVGLRGCGALRLANVGRAVVFALVLVAENAWMNHGRGLPLVLWGAAAFVAGLVVFQGRE